MEVFKKALIAAKNNHPDLLPEVIIDILSTGMDYAKGGSEGQPLRQQVSSYPY